MGSYSATASAVQFMIPKRGFKTDNDNTGAAAVTGHMSYAVVEFNVHLAMLCASDRYASANSYVEKTNRATALIQSRFLLFA